MLADCRRWSRVGSGNADSEAHLAVGDVVHPLLVEDVLSRDVGCHVTTNWVTHVCGTVGVKLTTVITWDNVDLGEVTVGHHLNVERRLDEVDSSDGTVWNDTGVVSGFGAVSNGLSLNVTDGGLSWWSESAPVIDRVDGGKSGVRGWNDCVRRVGNG